MKRILLLAISCVLSVMVFAQGTETFSNITTGSGTYATRTWTGDNGLLWTATDARTDSAINGAAVCIRNGAVGCTGIPNGIASLSFKHKQFFSGTGGVLEVRINGNLIGTANPTTTLATATFNNINITGAFTLEIKQTTSGLRIGIDDIVWTGYSGSPCATPTAQPTGYVFSNITTTSIDGSFTAASPAADEYLVVRSTSATLSATPVDGNTYDESDVLGNGVVVTRTSVPAFSASTLTSATTYYFFTFAMNSANCSGGPKYLTASPLTNSATTATPPVCAAPPAVGALTLTPSSTSVNGSFANVTGADGYMVVRSSSATLGAIPVNNTTYTEGSNFGSGIIIKYGTGNGFAAIGLTASTNYYFYVFSISNFTCTGGPKYSTTASGNSVTTTAAASTGEPSGYYSSATGLTCAALKTALKNIVTTGHNPKSYDDLWSQYANTDIRVKPGGSTNVIWDIYSTKADGTGAYYFTPNTNQCGTYSGEGSCYNREHSFPKSWFNDEMPSYSDYNHIFPTDGYVNGKRSNFKYGEVGSATWTSQNGSKLGSSSTAGVTGTVFEPIDEFKGDVARAYLYMVTRYQDRIITWSGYSTDGATTFSGGAYPSVNVNYLKLMLKWHHLDPVSQKEITRNNGTYSFQGNRNPYIDHPEFADEVWNSNCPGLAGLPVDVLFFTGKLQGSKVVLLWDVANEINLDRYEVERSFNGTDYEKIGSVKASGLAEYGYNDNADVIRGRRVYYRLKKVDKDAKYAYSEVVTLHIPLNTKFTTYPNPASSFVKVQLNNNVNATVNIVIVDMTGKVVSNANYSAASGLINVPVQAISNGTYLMKLTAGGEIFTQKIIIAK